MVCFKLSSIPLILLHFIVHENLFSVGDALAGNIGLHKNDGAAANDPLHIKKALRRTGKKKYSIIKKNQQDGGIMWEDLSAKRQTDSQYILSPSSGFVQNGHLCGILGPSGSGKTTFVSSIAGRPEPSLQVGGYVLHRLSDAHQAFQCAPVVPEAVAWLRQHDAFFERLTVKETLDLAVFLELPQLSATQRNRVADGCLDSLGLAKLKSRQIGNPKRTSDGGSLSGGELRRLSVALELVTKPNLFIADEPTSGIDAKMSENVMMAISSLAKQRQIPCFCTIHQPRSSIWHMLDSVILMAPGGRVCYVGSRENSVNYFAELGYECPDETNPAEFFIDLVSVHPEDPVQAKQDNERIEQLEKAFMAMNHKAAKRLEAVRISAPVGSLRKNNAFQGRSPVIALRVLRRFGALFRRSWRQTIRSKSLNVFRLAMSVGTAVLLSQIFPSVAKGPPTTKSIADRICVLSFGAINIFLIAIMKTIGIFAKEKPVVQRERSRKDYTSFEYILSKSLAEIPLDILFSVGFVATLKSTTGLAIGFERIATVFSLMTLAGASLGFLLGSITKSEEAAVATAMPVVIILMIVGVINPSGVSPDATTPFLVKIVKKASPIAAAIEGLAVSEFSGMEFARSSSLFGFRKFRDLPRMGGLALVTCGNDVLDALGLSGVKYNGVLVHMIVLSLLNFGLCWLGLELSGLHWENLTYKARNFFVQWKRALRGQRKQRANKKGLVRARQKRQPTTKAVSDFFPSRIISKPHWIRFRQGSP